MIDNLLTDKKFNATQAARAVGYSREHWSRLVKSGKAPQPLMIAGQPRWTETQLTAWLIDQNPQLKETTNLQQQAANVAQLRHAS